MNWLVIFKNFFIFLAVVIWSCYALLYTEIPNDKFVFIVYAITGLAFFLTKEDRVKISLLMLLVLSPVVEMFWLFFEYRLSVNEYIIDKNANFNFAGIGSIILFCVGIPIFLVLFDEMVLKKINELKAKN